MINNYKIDGELISRILFFLSIFAMVLGTFDNVWAEDASSGDTTEDPIGTQLCKVIDAINSGTARAVGICAVFGLAGALMMAKIQWTTALITSSGIIVMFSASSMVAFIGGDGASGC
ncbi:MAG: TrbC/VirB2 family protein [Rickettsiaceae bacterium]|nr:TrbC/VirB2 family protein [Rickettsiaceae bacterium]